MADAGWRFAGISPFDAATGGAGPVVAMTGAIELVAGPAAVRQSIMMLLSTRPGERVMRPEYGCPLYRIVFSPNDATTAGLAIHYVRQALLRFEPRAEILCLDAGPAGDGSGDTAGSLLVIRLDYRVRGTQQSNRLSLTLDLAAGPT